MNKMSMWIKIAALLYAGLFLAACPTGTEAEAEAEKDSMLTIVNSSSYTIRDVKWMGNVVKDDFGDVTLQERGASGSARVQSGSDYLYFILFYNGEGGSGAMNLRTRDRITVSGGTAFTLNDATIVMPVGYEDNTGPLKDIVGFMPPDEYTPPVSYTTSLKIKNESTCTISDIKWQNQSAAPSTLEPGSSGTIYLSEGASGYIYFKKVFSSSGGTNPTLDCRTQAVVTVEAEEAGEFTFTDNTIAVEINDTANVQQPLGTIARKVTALTIKNQSSSALASVAWQGIAFAPNEDENSFAIGATVTKEVGAGSVYIYFTKVLNSSGGANSTLDCRTQSNVEVETGKTKEFVFTDDTVVVDINDTANVQPLGTIAKKITALAIKNQSFSDLVSVEWQGIAFVSNTIENSLTIGNTVKNEVEAGTGYIFFKRKSNPAFARTSEMVTIGAKEAVEFVFTDNTEIVEANNPGNTGTLKDMTTSVVFFDDAEGDEQNYAERKGSAYYAERKDLPYSDSYNTNYNYFYPPYTGTGKSIALGGITDAKLRLSLTLERRAKVSFRFANKDYQNYTTGAAFSIDGDEKAAWQGDHNWAYQEYTLEAGSHDLVWTKHGRYGNYSYSYSYLSLDNILVYYIE
jgi:hypothetical protein